MDNYFYEQIVEVKNNEEGKKLRVVIIALSILAVLVLNFFLAIIGTIVSVILLVIVFKVFLPKLNIEFEYAITNNYLQIATIYNKEKRKENATIDIREVELIAPANSTKMEYYRNTKKVFFISGDQNAQLYSILVKTDKGLQNILIEPDDRLVELMKKQASINMYLK